MLVDQNFPLAEIGVMQVQAAARSLALQLVPLRVSAEGELEHVPPQLNRGDSREAKDRRVYRH